MKILLAALLAVLPAAKAYAGLDAAEDEKKIVSRVVKSTVDEVLKVLQNKELSPEARRAKVMDIIEPYLDYQLMAKLTLGRKHWPDLEETKRDEFTKLFVELLKTSYFEKLDLFTDEKIEYQEPVRIGNKYDVPTKIVSKDQRIAVVYKLYNKDGLWRTYDIVIEGISLVKSYSSQYGEFLQDKPFDELLKTMRQKIADGKAKLKKK